MEQSRLLHDAVKDVRLGQDRVSRFPVDSQPNFRLVVTGFTVWSQFSRDQETTIQFVAVTDNQGADGIVHRSNLNVLVLHQEGCFPGAKPSIVPTGRFGLIGESTY